MGLARIRAYLLNTRDPMANVLLVLPLVLLYGAGVVFFDPRAFNGADFITERLYSLLGRDWLGVTYGVVALGFACALTRMNRTGSFTTGTFALILAESLVYAVLLGEATIRILWHLGLGPQDSLL